MRNLKSVHLVTTENLLKPQLEGFLGANLPSIHTTKLFQIYRKLKEASEKVKKAKISGIVKLALSTMYLVTLVYFLTVLLF